MEIRTSEGIQIYCLPDDAKCLADEEKRSPEQMDQCPLCTKPWENICKPETCPQYTEGE